ncbi:ABC transporter substrate-binding protein [Holophaga foetida]|uniref:ABC transporter substrate-binding protein n=1 Tax=Holophaga foetida TaxID=35839 RepID=UPI000247530B|nr:ABC transporter substrate-binding protein [Holophaga foetida]
MKLATAVSAGLAALALVLGSGCDRKEQKEIKVGFVMAQTGMFAPFGQGGIFGVKAAIEDVNRLGGVKVGGESYTLKLVAVDSESDPNKAGALAESLIVQDKVQFIVTGDDPFPMHPAVASVVDKYKIPCITGVGPQEPWFAMREQSPTKWKYTWCMGSFAINTPAPAGDFRAKKGYTVMDSWLTQLDLFGAQTNKKIGIIASDEPDGRGWYTLFGPILKKKGFEVVGLEKNLGLVPYETNDFSSIIAEWKKAGVEILWGNCPGPFFGTVWRQAKALGFNPRIVSLGRGALQYDDVNAWGNGLAEGVCTEMWWDGTMQNCPGFGGATPKSLTEKWLKETKRPVICTIGPAYAGIQVLVDALQRANSLDPEKVNAALAKTDLMTMRHRVKFDENQFSRGPIVFGQWFKTDKPEKWELRVIHSDHDFWPASDKAIFPVPGK